MKTLALLLPLLFAAAHAASPQDTALAAKATADLRAVVANDHDLPRLHAAEDLAILGDPDPLAPIQSQVPTMLTQPIFRIVTWRVKARQAQYAHQSFAPYAKPVVDLFVGNPDASDRVNAAETLGKIGYYPSSSDMGAFRTAAQGHDELAVEARWVLANGGKSADERSLAAFLQDASVEKNRGDAAYALRFRPKIHHETYSLLVAAARKESKTSSARAYLYSAALVHAAPADRAEFLAVVEQYVDHGDAESRFEVMNGLAQAGDRSELERLSRFVLPAEPFDDHDADFQVGASYAILQILRR